jgi:hypothetical protein
MANLRKPPVDYENAFKFNGHFQIESEDDGVKNCTIEVDKLPDLVLTTGKIVVGDPFSVEEGHTIAKRVNPGAYTVDRASRKDTRPDHPGSYWYEVACVRVVVSRLRPVRWTPAMPSDKFASLLMSRADECCIADAQSIQAVCAGGSSVYDLMYGDRNTLDVLLDPETGGNLVRSGLLGYGAGPSCTFWGIDKNDKPCRLVFDFGVLSEPIYTEKTIAMVEELLAESIQVKTRCGHFEVSAKKHKRGQELRIGIAGDSVKNWNDLNFKAACPAHCELLSSNRNINGKNIEFQYRVISPKTPLECPFIVKYKTGVRSLL